MVGESRGVLFIRSQTMLLKCKLDFTTFFKQKKEFGSQSIVWSHTVDRRLKSQPTTWLTT